MATATLLEPLFVDRANELAEFATVLDGLAVGRRRHIALLGLRRIGKTLLLDEVRRLHPRTAIAYLALDEVVASPEDFARALVAEVLRAAFLASMQHIDTVLGDEDLKLAAAALHADLAAYVDEILALAKEQSHGALLVATMRFPWRVSTALDIPLLMMLDEFQEVVRLAAFPRTGNLLGTIRVALDRRGKVAYAVAGSRVTAMRRLLSDGESPLFTRFEQLDLGPFSADGTHDLATRVWSDDDLRAAEPDAAVRLHKLTGGWPFYVHAVAARAGQIARAANGIVTADTVDVAFCREIVGRVTNVGQHCRYLLDTALRADADGMRNALEAVLRQVARWQPISRASVERRLRRHYPHTRIHNAVNLLVDTDFMREAHALLDMPDPIFAFWLDVEPERRDPEAMGAPEAVRRLVAFYQAQHGQERQEMGTLFERRIENVARQFKGQRVAGKLFGAADEIQLPVVLRAGRVRVDDAAGQFGEGPDSYEVDIVTAGNDDADFWAIEAKHRQGAITRAMVQRFLKNASGVAKTYNIEFARLWMVAPRGVRPDALELARNAGVLTSGLRQLEQLEGLVAEYFATTSLRGRDLLVRELPVEYVTR